MRSSVVSMLSNSVGEPYMSHPDYDIQTYHHGCLLVLLRGIGPSKPRSLQRIFEKVRRINNVKIIDSSGNTRDIWIRYIHDHPVENNDWGDFQTHRRLLGLITIGKFENQVELNELCRLHESLKVKYSNTLYDSRSILFGPNESASLEEEFKPPDNFKTLAFFYKENDTCSDLDGHMTEFANSLFYILESKRLERSREKVDKFSLLQAPFEKRDFVGLDLESRNNKKRCVGRVTKNLADLTLQAGLIGDSLNLYQAASETLGGINDSLWYGAAQEGLCAVSSILLYPHLRETETFHRNASLQPTPMSSSSSSVSSILNSSSTSSLSNSAGSNTSNLPTNSLHPDEIPQFYRKAIINYSKYSHAGIIETEAALKAARICVEQNKNLDVCMFLQNILFINVNMTEHEKIKRFEVLTEIYEQIGYKRKAAFCRRLAAWKYVNKGLPMPDWPKSYKLMLDSFPGYLLSLDPLEVIDNNAGWPTLQIDLLNSLIGAANRIGHSHSALATRHMTFLLQTQWNNMTLSDQRERAVQLQNLSSQCEGSPVPLVLENGIVIPPANLTDIPYCIQMQVMDLENYMRPHKIALNKNDSGPFIFTPIHNYSSIERREKARSKDTKVDFYWVQNDMCTVTIKLKNNLPFELTVSDMRLLTNGIVFEACPSTVVLQPSAPTTVKLYGTPLEVGALEIQGFSTHTLGVKSNCRLKHMKNRKFPNSYIVNVIPALPNLLAQTNLEVPPLDLLRMPGTIADNIICGAYISLYNGESSECMVTLRNESQVPVEHLDISMTSNVDNELIKKIIKYNESEIQSYLPIQPNTEVRFKVDIFAEADFLCSLPTISGHGPQSLGFSTISSGHASLPSRMSSPIPKRGGELTSSFRSTNSSSLNFPNSHQSTGNPNAQVVDAFIKIRYSGGEAMTAGYCRQCTIRFNLELLPSAQVTTWDVLPAETASQFYLVIDVSNLTSQEMSLNYTENKNILIEAQESCRVPIPVDRCEVDDRVLRRSDDLVENENGIYTPPPSLQELTANACSVHIAERVKLNWILAGSENKGIASLKGITLTSAMMDLIAVSPLQWVVSFDNTPVQPQSEVVCKVGQSVNLSVSVTSQSVTPLRQLSLTVQFYQDYLNGTQSYNLETRVTMSGSNHTIIPVLEKGESTSHECAIVFFTPGRFKVNIQCKSLAAATTAKPLPNGHINFQLPQSAGLSTTLSYHEMQSHLWKFIPPIELTVLE